MAISEIGVIRVDLIKVPQIVQREFRIEHAKMIIENFRREILGVLTVSKMGNGTYLVIDGQHRLYAMKFKGIKTANCILLPEMSEEEMARVFRGLADSKKMSALDKFRSEVRSKEPDVVSIQEICDRYHIPVGSDSEKHQIRGYYLRAVNVARQILRDFGYERLDQTMRILTSAWPGQPYAMYEPMVNGVALFTEYFGKQANFDEAKAVRQLSKRTAEAIVCEGRERRRNRGAIPAIEIATTILRNLYNHRLHKDKQLRVSAELEELAFKSK